MKKTYYPAHLKKYIDLGYKEKFYNDTPHSKQFSFISHETKTILYLNPNLFNKSKCGYPILKMDNYIKNHAPDFYTEYQYTISANEIGFLKLDKLIYSKR